MSGFEASCEGRDERVGNILSRRNWLRGSIALLGVMSFGASIGKPGPWCGQAQFENWMLRIGANSLGDAATLCRLGATYLSGHPAENDRARLSKLLGGECKDPIEVNLIKRIARDWSEHDLVTLDGWVLARTEARVCASLHLLEGDHV